MLVIVGVYVAQVAIWLYLSQWLFEGKAWATSIVFATAFLAQYALFVWKRNKEARSRRAEGDTHARQLQQLHGMLNSLPRSRSREQLLENILAYLKNTIPNSTCAVYLATDDKNGILKLDRLTWYDSESLPVPDRVPVMDAVTQKTPFTAYEKNENNGLQVRVLSTLSGRLRSVGAVDLYKPEGLSPEESALYQSLIDYASNLWALYESLASWEEEAFIDPLTGVWNRRYIMRRQRARSHSYGSRRARSVDCSQ
jgi:hypothetical protein